MRDATRQVRALVLAERAHRLTLDPVAHAAFLGHDELRAVVRVPVGTRGGLESATRQAQALIVDAPGLPGEGVVGRPLRSAPTTRRR